MFRLIVFDLDGTLIDSRRDIADAANALLQSCGAEPLPEERIGRMVGDGAATLVARAFTASGLEKPADALDRYLEFYATRLLTHTRPYPGVAAVLQTLSASATLAVQTNKPQAATREILDGLDLARYFSADAVLGGDGPFARKPDPSGLRHLAASAGVPLADTLLVGDSIVDWRTARAAPAGICLARYGFGFDGFPISQLGPSDRVIDTPMQLLGVCRSGT
ncbi:MAG: HAD hydrolase-like protein [Acidobacteria bacterium]|nr:HAD hydrolase-like protein [Acidobacteriota bacterium]